MAAQVINHYFGAVLGHHQRLFTANSAARAGYDNHFSVE